MLRLLVILSLIGITSCERPVPASAKKTAAESNPVLASAQLQLAISHLAKDSPAKAIPYLDASLRNNPSEDAKKILTQILTENRFKVPTYRLDHPFPFVRYLDGSSSVFVATGSEHSTLVRWKISPEPKLEAILFPAKNAKISDISISPDAKYLLVHRGETNLLCNADTLKPITNLGTFPDDLNSDLLQPFSDNSLLIAHPTRTEQNLVWHIRDTATGETLRSETFQRYPAPEIAVFDNTELVITLEDNTQVHIPIVGDVRKKTLFAHKSLNVRPSVSSNFTIDGNALTYRLPIPYTPGTDIDLKLLSGYALDPDTQELTEVPIPDRLAALSQTFPEQIPPTFRIFSSEREILARLAIAFPEDFPELAAAQIAHAGIVWQTFESGDPAAISALLSALPPDGLPTATALFLALKSQDPDIIKQVLAVAKNVPEPIHQLSSGTSNYSAEQFAALRLEQDWKGYESPDFTPLVAEIESKELGAMENLQLSDDPTQDEIEAFITYLLSPETLHLLGAGRLSTAALSAAGKLAHDEDHATTAIQLAAVARRLAADEAAVLRINATALTSQGDFEAAHRTWLNLITNQPEAVHLASDYSEAAYTAFENANTEQAMEILNTGLFRFPNDSAFTIRAGWISLLTDHADEALRYLQRATELGLPANEVENTTALLAIVHTQLGDSEKALGFLEQLKAIDAKWADPETIEALNWPEPLKASLRQLVWQP